MARITGEMSSTSDRLLAWMGAGVSETECSSGVYTDERVTDTWQVVLRRPFPSWRFWLSG